jgi:glyoxylase-like metal-dependent hydrolase (beta-lactamase superfamily II)
MDELSRGIFRWTAPHPEWRTRIPWGHEVASFALVAADALVLIDPQLPAEGSAALAPLLAELDRLAGSAGRLEIMITVPYHARSAEPLYGRYRAKLASRIWAHPALAKRFAHETPFTRIEPGVSVAGLARAFAIGNPRRHETPLYFADHKALAFGDSVIGFEDTLRVWQEGPASPVWYRERLLPTLRPLLELDVERVLVTHGPAVVEGGHQKLQAALAAPPWDCR